MNFRIPRAFAALALLIAVPAFAHHGWSEYDTDHPLTLQGRIAASSYANPHATIMLDASDKRYAVVLAPVSRMEARGASRESVAVGQDVTVVGFASKAHADEVRAERLVIGSGPGAKTVELR